MGYSAGTPETSAVSFQSVGASVDPTTITFSYTNNGVSYGPFTFSGESVPGVGYIYRYTSVTGVTTTICYAFQIDTTGFVGPIIITWVSTGTGAAALTKSIEPNVNEVQGTLYPWAPGVDDVGDVLRARTVNRNGLEIGTFDAFTRPTDVDVMGLINQAASDIQDAIGVENEVPADQFTSAEYLTALGTALLIEIGFYPEQVNSGRSPYPQIETMYKDRLKRLQDAVVSEGGARPVDEFMQPFGAFNGPPVPMGWFYPRL
jgi:hypothetical protein